MRRGHGPRGQGVLCAHDFQPGFAPHPVVNIMTPPLPKFGSLCVTGADPMARDNQNWNSLMFASRYGYTEVVELLSKYKMELLDARDHKGWSALMLAAGHGHCNVVAELLKQEWVEVYMLLASFYYGGSCALLLSELNHCSLLFPIFWSMLAIHLFLAPFLLCSVVLGNVV